MQYTIKLFAEITIKSRPVRQRMVRMLRDNLRTLIKPLDPDIVMDRNWDYIGISSQADDATQAQIVDVLKRTPGISHFQCVHEFPLYQPDTSDVDWEGIFAHTRAVYGELLAGKTFRVSCRRLGNHNFQSADIERYIGGGLNQHCPSAGVKLKHPDINVPVEIRHDRFYVIEQDYPGLGGFPMATQDAVLSLISGGFDSTVSTFLTMKRGLLTHFCFFNLGGDAHEIAVKEIAVYLWMKYGASHRVKFISVPFADVVREIQEKVHHSQMGVILKRMMLRAASEMAQKLEIPALVTGEAVAQVSSQTLQNLSVITQATDMLVLRPLITMDKPDIIDYARKIGTEVFAKNIPEYCGVISQKPTTRAKLERIQREETRFDFAVLQQAIADSVSTNIDQITRTQQQADNIHVFYEAPVGSVILDIRHPDEEQRKPLALPGAVVQTLPFYQLHKRHTELDRQTHYLLYCERGVMSRLQAEFLRGQDFPHISVFQKK
ncbi:MAG: tRNA 4-thiouridine(8) synthase ThiI [Cellvibrionales bacterium]|jgi:thiamine biosynthesis protein ThiI|nr:tRNA 4-thiouridine(8) synthase ThiI [Cellvibrionales bacterium]